MSDEPEPSYRPTNEKMSPEAVDDLRQRLLEVHRDAVSIARVVENMLNMPPEQRAIRTRADRRRIDRGRANR